MGSRGFDCSPESLELLKNLGKKTTEKQMSETLEEIRENMGDCHRCPLSETRTNIVFGEGDPNADIVFIGEGPGHDEDVQGLPFVGRAGKLLTKIINAMGLNREDVYITNIIKCRPPGNRNPMSEEIAACFPFLERQLEAIRPRYICALGTFAAQTLLETNTPISRLRGKFHEYKGIKLIPTFHPAYLLRNPNKKREVWEDIQKLMKDSGLD
jgi:DNA polymerase